MAANSTVDVSDFVNVTVAWTPNAIPFENFGTLMILGDSPVIDVNQRYRQYSDILEFGNDFASNTPEFAAAELFFEQNPRPAIVFAGRWASTATPGILHGAILLPVNQLIAFWNNITNGSLHITIDAVAHDISGLNFSSALNLNGVAAAIQAALRTAYTSSTIRCNWDAGQERFDIISGTTGPSSTVSYASVIGTLGATTDVSHFLGLQSSQGSPLVLGQAAESALSAVQALANATSAWYGIMDAATIGLQPTDYIAIASYILASSRSRIFGTTIQNTACLDPTQTADLASVLQSLNNQRVFSMYSSTNGAAVATMFGRGFTVDFAANRSTITLAYKQAPGLAGENLTETQFATLIGKGGNANIKVNNGAVMLWNGQMSNGYWFDEVQGVDWLQNQIQTDVFNLLYTTTTKIAQTDDDSVLLSAAIAQGCEAGVNNGLIAPGQWNASGFGALKQFDHMAKGYYIYYPSVDTQPENVREERISVPFQVAVKLAGAVQIADILLNINP